MFLLLVTAITILGFTGDGHSCADVDECAADNGGCSLSPRVSCRNLVGGVECGACPVGYTGDGRTCEFRGRCATLNGGCSSLARCLLLPTASPYGLCCGLQVEDTRN